MRIALTVAMLALALPAFAAGHAVQIKGMKFSPARLNVAVGDTITGRPSPVCAKRRSQSMSTCASNSRRRQTA